MRKESRTTPREPKAYQLPESEYRALVRARDQMRLCAHLLEPHAFAATVDELPVSLLALVNCFARFADELDDIANAAWWPKRVVAER